MFNIIVPESFARWQC